MRYPRQFGAIVIVPRIYVAEAIRESGTEYWPAIIGLIQEHTPVELPDNANICPAFDIAIKEDFDANTLLVRITAMEPIPGLWELVPGNQYPRHRLEFNHG